MVYLPCRFKGTFSQHAYNALAFSVIALSFCIAFAVLTFAGILAQYTALCAAFFALVSSGLSPALPFQPRYFPAQARTYGI